MAFHTLAAPHGGHAEYATADAATTSFVPARTSYEGESPHYPIPLNEHVVPGIMCLPLAEAATIPLSPSTVINQSKP